jgi:hypothetical protein
MPVEKPDNHPELLSHLLGHLSEWNQCLHLKVEALHQSRYNNQHSAHPKISHQAFPYLIKQNLKEKERHLFFAASQVYFFSFYDPKQIQEQTKTREAGLSGSDDADIERIGATNE